MARQTGAILVDTFDELIDVVKGLVTMSAPMGPRMGLVATTGGQSVVISDTFAKAGLQVPTLTDKSYETLATFFSTIGGSYRNPLDMTPTSRDGDLVRRALGVLAADPNVDAVCYDLSVGLAPAGGPRLDERVEMLADLKTTLPKPLFVAVNAAHREALGAEARKALADKGVTAYPSFQRASAAYRKLLDYYTAKRELAEAS
jgi:acetyltransferase